jgi:T5SS/PEP-CTERM-associated repeat protein
MYRRMLGRCVLLGPESDQSRQTKVLRCLRRLASVGLIISLSCVCSRARGQAIWYPNQIVFGLATAPVNRNVTSWSDIQNWDTYPDYSATPQIPNVGPVPRASDDVILGGDLATQPANQAAYSTTDIVFGDFNKQEMNGSNVFFPAISATVNNVILNLGGFTFDFSGINGHSGNLSCTTLNLGTTMFSGSGNSSLLVTGPGTLAVQSGLTVGNEVSTTGQLTVTGTGASITAAFANVGNSGSGALTVQQSGKFLTSGGLTVASNAGSTGQATISGTGSSITSGFANLGFSGNGTLTVQQGGSFVENTNLAIAVNAGSTSQMTVSGAGSTATLGADSYIGYSGNGTLTVQQGGALMITGSAGLGVGINSGSKGQLTVTGTGSSLVSGGPLYDGYSGDGAVTVQQGGTLTFTGGGGLGLGANSGSTGQLTISGTGSSVTTDGNILVGVAFIPPPVFGPNGGTATLTVNAGSKVSAGGTVVVGNSGTVDVSGGGVMTIGNVGALIPTAGSVLIGTGGALGGTGTIIGSVVNNSGTLYAVFSPGVIHITGSYTQSTNATMSLTIGGLTAGTQFDQLHVTGQMTLGGTLAVKLINGFVAALGNSFDLLDWGSISGTFSTLQLPSPGGTLGWDTSHLYTTGVISVVNVGNLRGDFNRDGHVDSSDVTAMLAALVDLNGFTAANGLSTANLLSIADINGDGVVNNADLQGLLTLLKSGGGSTSIVAEPSSLVLLMIGGFLVMSSPRRRLMSGPRIDAF